MKRRRIFSRTTNNPQCHPLRKQGKQTAGFTLIELLVVIFIISALVAILVPSLQAARRQAGAAACQARLRQWGLAFRMYLDENKGRWMSPSKTMSDSMPLWLRSAYPFWSGIARGRKLESHFSEKNDTEIIGIHQCLAMCPMTGQGKPYPFWPRKAFYEGRRGRSEKLILVSYAFNSWLYSWQVMEGVNFYIAGKPILPGAWGTCDVRGASVIPVFGDGLADGYMCHDEGPPKTEQSGPLTDIYWRDFCINRHNGGINMLFMDWSVRKVGLKELWTLKWSRTFDTAGPWTLAGGVKPEDWPAWMQRFKDY